MGIFFILFLIFIFWFLIRPVFRLWYTVRNAQKQANDFFRGTTGNRGQSAGYAQREPRQRSYRRSHKKIDPNVGEYVEFEEISTYHGSSSDTGSTVKFTRESQIEDAEWEDLR